MSDRRPQTVLSLTPEGALDVLAEAAWTTLATAGRARVMIGLAGGPGVGKSTLAEKLVQRLGTEQPGIAAYVPMDGFHMWHDKLKRLGTAHEKGGPHTFEAAAFAAFLRALRASTEDMPAPGYSRQIEDVVENMLVVPGGARLLVVEGNYLLLEEGAWGEVRPMLDLAVFIAVPRDLVRRRLLARHAEAGLFTAERNRDHVERVDLNNFDRVAASQHRADLVIEIITAT